AQVFLPPKLPFQIVAKQPFGTQESNQIPAVSRQRGIGVGRLRVPLDFRRSFVDRLHPERLARILIQAVDVPRLSAVIVRGIARTVEADLQLRIRLIAYGGYDK